MFSHTCTRVHACKQKLENIESGKTRFEMKGRCTKRRNLRKSFFKILNFEKFRTVSLWETDDNNKKKRATSKENRTGKDCVLFRTLPIAQKVHAIS